MPPYVFISSEIIWFWTLVLTFDCQQFDWFDSHLEIFFHLIITILQWKLKWNIREYMCIYRRGLLMYCVYLRHQGVKNRVRQNILKQQVTDYKRMFLITYYIWLASNLHNQPFYFKHVMLKCYNKRSESINALIMSAVSLEMDHLLLWMDFITHYSYTVY